MRCLIDILKKEPDYARMSDCVKKGDLPLAASGLSGVHKAFLSAALNKHIGKKLLVVTPDEPTALNLKNDLLSFGTNALLFCARDYNTTRMSGY